MRGTWSEENLRRLRAARHAGDGAALVALLSGLPFAEVLQQVGDAAGDAVTARVPGAADLAERCIAALGERDWEGDAELARQLGAALGRGAMPPLRPLPVDLEELSGVLEGDPVLGGGRISGSANNELVEVATLRAQAGDVAHRGALRARETPLHETARDIGGS